MSWGLVWSPHARRDLRRLDRQTTDRVLTAMERYAETGAGNITHLTDRRPPEWRLRVGDYRIRFGRDDDARALVVLRVLNRREAYR